MSSKDLAINASKETGRITSFIGEIVGRASANGLVVALSGGIDSAVVGALCVNALGRTRVLGLLLPSDHTPKEDTEDAKGLADSWGIKSENVPISKVVKMLVGSAEVKGTKIAQANIQARVRMMVTYYHANTLGYLVAGTGDRSEELLGYFTKFGDGGVDFLPIAHLYKTQVRALGTHLGLPKRVVEKPASPQLWSGQKATDEIPAEYDKLDIVLHQLFDLKAKPHEAAFRAGVPVSVVEKVLEMHRRTEHKRRMPPSLGLV
ncbi:MAG: NAD+ synthase [Thaumarchaeota archaeon]|nr:NAD+ synthase [Nitrososphaerota archaeon]